jgi:hypothetical protein
MLRQDITAILPLGGSRALYARLLGVRRESYWVRAGDLRHTADGFSLTPTWDSPGFEILWEAASAQDTVVESGSRIIFAVHNDGGLRQVGAVALTSRLAGHVQAYAPQRSR